MNSKPARPAIPLRYERQLWARGIKHVAGIDEAGRGPLAGPVVAAAVIIGSGEVIEDVQDSKLIPSEVREELFDRLTSEAIAYGVGIVGHDIIDEINILQATYRAMHEAIRNLSPSPDHVLVDGNRFSGMGIPFTVIIDGDARCYSIAAASIIAKVTRDRLMQEFDKRFPGYGFAKHKGYGTAEHREAIRRLGLCEIHRRSFTTRPQLELEFNA